MAVRALRIGGIFPVDVVSRGHVWSLETARFGPVANPIAIRGYDYRNVRCNAFFLLPILIHRLDTNLVHFWALSDGTSYGRKHASDASEVIGRPAAKVAA